MAGELASVLAAGLQGWNEGRDIKRQREREAAADEIAKAAAKRKATIDNLSLQSALQDIGARKIASPEAARLVAPGSLMARINAGQSPILPANEAQQTFNLDGQQYAIDPEQTREARTERRAEARDNRTLARLLRIETLRQQGSLAEAVARQKPRYSFKTNKAGRLVRVDEDTLKADEVPGVEMERPVDPFARMAETFREQAERADADKWFTIYRDAMEAKRDKYGEVIEGTGLPPEQAAARADEAFGGRRPRMAPQVKATPKAAVAPVAK